MCERHTWDCRSDSGAGVSDSRAKLSAGASDRPQMVGAIAAYVNAVDRIPSDWRGIGGSYR